MPSPKAVWSNQFEHHVWDTFRRFYERLTTGEMGDQLPGDLDGAAKIAQIAATLTQAAMTSEQNRSLADICDLMPSAGRGT